MYNSPKFHQKLIIINFPKYLLIGLICIASCTVDSTPVSVENIISNKDFRISVITYGGLIGEGKVTYDFEKGRDSVYVNITHHYIRPKEKYRINLSKSEYSKIESSFKCLADLHCERAVRGAGCQPPFDREYYFERMFQTIRVYPENQDTCLFELEYLFPEYESDIVL